MSKKGYVAGPLFNEAEIGQRLKEGKMLKELIPSITFYNPIEAPVNDKSTLPTAEDIFQMDTDYILDSDYILADLAHEDPGVTMELGIVYGVEFARKELLKVLEEEGIGKEKIERIEKALEEKGIKKRHIATHNSDIRIPTAGQYVNVRVPYGYNQYVVGGIYKMYAPIKGNAKEAIEYLASRRDNEIEELEKKKE